MGLDEKLGWDLWERSSYYYFRVSFRLTKQSEFVVAKRTK